MISILGIIDKLNELIEPAREWLFKNHNNPIFWISVFVGAIMIFLFAYSALQKEK